MGEISNNKKIVLFDGVCNLCNGIVQFILKRDPKGQFILGSLQSPQGKEVANRFNAANHGLQSLLLIDNDVIYDRSTAVLRILRALGRGWQLSAVLLLLPRKLRDHLYDWVARHRYQWFGIRDTCMVPDKKWEDRFL